MPTVSTQKLRWWGSDKNSAHRNVFPTIAFVREQQRTQRLDLAIYLELYSAGNVSGIGRTLNDLGSYYSGMAPGLRGARFNMVAACVDTAHSLIAASPPVPIYVTSGTNLSIVRKADKRSKVLQSQMNEIGMRVSREAFHTACKLGTGVVYGYLDEDGLPRLEHVNPLEIFVEHQDGYYREPRSIHRVKYISRDVLAEMFPKHKGFIDKAASPNTIDYASRFLISGVRDLDLMVEVVESWHLGYGETRRGNAKAGRHTITISNCDLLDEDYKGKEFPFAIVRYRNRAFGFFGAGLIESTREAQNRVNHLIKRVARGQDLGSNIIIFNPNGEGSIDPQWLSNEVGMIFNYEHGVGTPQLAKWDGTMADLQQQIDLEFERILRVEGISESQMSGEGAGKGLTSGVAVRAQDDVMSRRLINPVQLFTDFNVDIAKLIARLNDEAAELDEGFVAKGYTADAGQAFLRSSTWRELDLPEGEAMLNMMPMNIMPTTPAGKWASVQEFVQAGFMNRDSAIKLLGFPALDAWTALESAQADLCKLQIEKMLDGEQVLPMPRQDLVMCQKTVTMAWAQMQQMQPDDAVVDAFDAYLDYIDSLIEEAQGAAANQNAAVAGGAPAAGPAQGGIAAAPMVQQAAA